MDLPDPDQLPSETRDFPYFNHSCSAFATEVESREVTEVIEHVGRPASSECSSDTLPPQGVKRRFTDRDGSLTHTPVLPTRTKLEKEGGSYKDYRLVYHYFDHIAIDEATPYEYVA